MRKRTGKEMSEIEKIKTITASAKLSVGEPVLFQGVMCTVFSIDSKHITLTNKFWSATLQIKRALCNIGET